MIALFQESAKLDYRVLDYFLIGACSNFQPQVQLRTHSYTSVRKRDWLREIKLK